MYPRPFRHHRKHRPAGGRTSDLSWSTPAPDSLQQWYQQAQADIKRACAEVETHRAKLNRLLGLSGSQTGWTLALSELPGLPSGDPSLEKVEAGLRQANDEVEAIESEIRNDIAASHTAMRLARYAAEYQTTTLLPQRQGILKETPLHYNAMQKCNIALLRA